MGKKQRQPRFTCFHSNSLLQALKGATRATQVTCLFLGPPTASSPLPLKYQKPGTHGRQTILKPWHCPFQKDSLWYFPGMVNRSIENCECFLHERHNTPVHSYLHSLNMTITHKTACLANSFLPHILAFSFTGWTYLIIKSRRNIKLNGLDRKQHHYEFHYHEELKDTRTS